MNAINCPICKKSTAKNYAIECCKCEKWFHIKCIGMTVTHLNNYERELKNNDGKRWLCKICNDKAAKRLSIGTPDSKEASTTEKKEYTLADVMYKLNNIENKYADLLNRFNQQEKVNTELRSEIDDLKRILTSKQDAAQTHVDEHPIDPIQEINEREYRKKNVIVFDAEERTDDAEADQKLVEQIIHLACPYVKMEELKINRIGRTTTGKVRPLKIRFPSAADVKKVIQKVSDLKKIDTLSSMSYSYDRTPKQREQYRTIKMELLRRSEDGEVGLKIRHINGIPKIFKPKN